MKFFKKKYVYSIIFSIVLIASFTYSMLKTFVLSETISTVSNVTVQKTNNLAVPESAKTTTNSYVDENMEIKLEQITSNDT